MVKKSYRDIDQNVASKTVVLAIAAFISWVPIMFIANTAAAYSYESYAVPLYFLMVTLAVFFIMLSLFNIVVIAREKLKHRHLPKRLYLLTLVNLGFLAAFVVWLQLISERTCACGG